MISTWPLIKSVQSFDFFAASPGLSYISTTTVGLQQSCISQTLLLCKDAVQKRLICT